MKDECVSPKLGSRVIDFSDVGSEKQPLPQDDRTWFAVQVRPRHELATAKILRNKGLEEFVPLYTSRRQWSDRQKEVVLPLFSGYIFCRFAPKAKLPVITTPGVIRLVGSRRGPIPITDHEIASIQTAVKLPECVRPHAYIAIGSRVRVEEGPFTGLEGILIDRKRSQLILSVDLVQRSIAIEINGYTISPVLTQQKSENTATLIAMPKLFISRKSLAS